MSDLSHYYYFAFRDQLAGGERYASSAMGLSHPKVTRQVIAWAKEAAGVSPDAFMLNCCYLGHMTAEEHHSGFE